MSRKCDHDWFDHYMMYSMMSRKGGGGNIGCGPILTLIGLGVIGEALIKRKVFASAHTI